MAKKLDRGPIAEFDDSQLDALTILAMLDAPVSASLWAQWIQACVPRRASSAAWLTALGDRCVALEWAERVASGPREHGYRMTRAGSQAVFARARERGRLKPLLEMVSREQEPGRREQAPAIRQWQWDRPHRLALATGSLRAALVLDDEAAIEVALNRLLRWCYDEEEVTAKLRDAFGYDPPMRWIAALPEFARAAYLHGLLAECMLSLQPPPEHVTDWFTDDDDPELRLEWARLFALRGDRDRVAALGQLGKGGPEAVELLRLFAAGEHRAAADFGDATVAAMKSRKHKQLKDLEGVVHALLRVATMDQNPTRAAALRQSLEHARGTRLGFDLCYADIDAFEQASRAAQPFKEPPLALATKIYPWWLALLVRLSCLHWLGFSLKKAAKDEREAVERLQAQAVANGYAGLARELSALLAVYAGAEPPTTSIIGCYRRRQPWEMILETIESTAKVVQVDAKPSARASDFRKHIVWEIELHSTWVEARPMLIASARASKGKALTLTSLLDGKHDCLSAADEKVLASIRQRQARGSRRRVEPPRFDTPALLALADHPRVRNADGTPLRITRGQPALRVRADAKAKTTKLELEPTELRYNEFVVRRVAPDHVEVFERDAKLNTLFDLFAGGKPIEIPADGRARLLDSLATLATSTELRVEGDAGLSGRTIAADSRVVMQLRWDGSTFVADARVAPLGAQGPHFRPGEGPTDIVARLGAELLSTTRDRGEERARFDAVLDACPVLASQPEDDGHWAITKLDTALEILLELHALADEVVLTWPKGRKLGVPRTVDASNLRVDVSSTHDWLAVGVELDVDEGRVLDFKQLIGKREGDGRFIALGEDRFVALTSDLRRRIDALEHLGAIKRAKLAAHPVALALIEDIVGEQASFTTDAEARARIERLRTIADKTPRLPRGLQATLRDYQLEGYRWMARLAEAQLGAVLADDMGLGKTIQALALLLARSNRGPALVVAPTSVVSNWQAEAERFAPSLRCHMLSKAGDRGELIGSLGRADVLLCSYGLLVSEAEPLAAVEFATVVFDEAHALKNSSSRRAKAAFALRSEFRLALTGTPLENHLGELWSVFQAAVPGLLSTQKRFDERFTRPISQGQRERARQLRAMIRPFVLRRTKAQVLDELPPRTEVTIRVTPSAEERAFYEALRREAIERTSDLDGKGGKARLRILAEITRLRQAAVDPRLVDPEHGPAGAKLAALIRRVVDLREEGHRALLFSQFLGSLAAIHEQLDAHGIRYLGFDGSTPAKQRAEAVAAFQAGEGDVFVMSLKAGGVGINLTGADYVIHIDPWWNPAVEDQATGRAHRIGQQRPVTVYRLVTEGTIEEQILELHASKRDLADDLLADLESAKKLDLDELRALLRG